MTRDLWRVGPWSGKQPVIERASSADLAFLAMEAGKIPQQFAAILLLEPSGDLSLPRFRQVISERILAIPRLRQRLVKVPVGCGHPVWVDDRDFHIDQHVRAVSCRHPGDERAVFDTALSVIMEPLPRRGAAVVNISDHRARRWQSRGCGRATPRPRRWPWRAERPSGTGRSGLGTCRRAVP